MGSKYRWLHQYLDDPNSPEESDVASIADATEAQRGALANDPSIATRDGRFVTSKAEGRSFLDREEPHAPIKMDPMDIQAEEVNLGKAGSFSDEQLKSFEGRPGMKWSDGNLIQSQGLANAQKRIEMDPVEVMAKPPEQLSRSSALGDIRPQKPAMRMDPVHIKGRGVELEPMAVNITDRKPMQEPQLPGSRPFEPIQAPGMKAEDAVARNGGPGPEPTPGGLSDPNQEAAKRRFMAMLARGFASAGSTVSGRPVNEGKLSAMDSMAERPLDDEKARQVGLRQKLKDKFEVDKHQDDKSFRERQLADTAEGRKADDTRMQQQLEATTAQNKGTLEETSRHNRAMEALGREANIRASLKVENKNGDDTDKTARMISQHLPKGSLATEILARDIEDIAAKSGGWDKVKGIGFVAGAQPNAVLDQAARELRMKAQAMLNNYQKQIAGTAVSPQESANVRKAVGAIEGGKTVGEVMIGIKLLRQMNADGVDQVMIGAPDEVRQQLLENLERERKRGGLFGDMKTNHAPGSQGAAQTKQGKDGKKYRFTPNGWIPAQ